MKRDCSCLGLNENCYKCWGSGYYENNHEIRLDIFQNTKFDPYANKGKGRKTLSSKRKIKKTQMRPYCKCNVMEDRMTNHPAIKKN